MEHQELTAEIADGDCTAVIGTDGEIRRRIACDHDSLMECSIQDVNQDHRQEADANAEKPVNFDASHGGKAII